MAELDSVKELIEDNPLDVFTKTVAAKVSPCVVGVSTRGSPEEVFVVKNKFKVVENEFRSSGTIIESDVVENGGFVSIILASATLFKHEGLQPHKVKVHVYLSDNEYEGELLGCDFHYNIAAIRIQSDSQLQAANLRSLDDIFPIDPTQHLLLCEGKSFLRPHSELYAKLPRNDVICLGLSCAPQLHLLVASGVFCMQTSSSLNCNELYRIKNLKKFDDGGPVCNYRGEVIGIMFYNSYFLPSNIVSRWWQHYKNYGEFRRPWLGLKVDNLHTARLEFLQLFLKKFPDVSAGVVVLEIAKDSPAYCSGIRPEDVIVKCDDELVRSNLEFFEKIWDKAGKTVEFTVLRKSDGSQLSPSPRMTIGETATDKFYQWHLPTSLSFKRRKLRSVST